MIAVSILEDVLRNRIPYHEGIKRVEDSFIEDASQNSPIIRAITCWEEGKHFDFLSHLRQVIIYNKRPLKVGTEALGLCKRYASKFMFIINEDMKTVDAKPWVEIDQDIKYAYEYSLKRSKNTSYPDGTLKELFGYDSYISLQQKTMIHTMKKMEKGDCLLACLPTGSGKSLLWQYGVACGKFRGLTIVIVPTNALSTDHIKGDRSVLSRMPWITSLAYSAKNSEESSEYIVHLVEQIEIATNTILYISPEGLTNNSIKRAIMNKASHGGVSAIVVDEAHLVIDWGMHFRPEFQFIPTLCNQISQKANGVYIVLLSATITPSDSDTLRQLFDSNNFIEFRGDELRPEIEFYSHVCDSEKERQDLLKKVVVCIPKPVIVYVGTKEQCSEYSSLIRNAGFSRVEQFTGDTGENERERLIDEWRDNKIDIMVATSAFGMGVDKSDVRSIITAYTPENISRFYQEVGRAGRDGFSALNISLSCPSFDSDVVDAFTDSKLATVELLVDRWKGLYKDSEPDKYDPDCVWIDTRSTPKHLKYSVTGSRNSGWNQNVVLQLVRCGLIQIEDVVRSYADNFKSFKLKIKIKSINTIENETDLTQEIASFREIERNQITEGKELVQRMLSKDNEDCYSLFFTSELIYANNGCNGCPSCRKNGLSKYFPNGNINLLMNSEIKIAKKYSFANSSSSCVNSEENGMVFYDDDLKEEEISFFIKKMVLAGVDIVVSPTFSKDMISSVLGYERNDYLLLTYDEAIVMPYNYFVGAIALIIPISMSDKGLDLYKSINSMGCKNIVLLCQKDLYDREEQHYVRDLLEYSVPMKNMFLEDVVC